MRPIVTVFLVLAACGDSGNGNNDMAAPRGDMAAAAGSGVIGANGGSVSLSDGTSVQIPAGALPSDTTITITPTTNAPSNAIGPAYVFGPEGTQFAKAVTVMLPYDPAKLTGSATPRVVTAPATSSNFTSLGGTAADTTHQSALTTHFSTFVVIAYVSTTDAGANMPQPIASSQFGPAGLSADSKGVYWINTYGASPHLLMKYDSALQTVTTLSPASSSGGQTAYSATDGTYVYFAQTGVGLVRCANAGCAMSPTAFGAGGGAGTPLAIDNSNLYTLGAVPTPPAGGYSAVFACPLASGCTASQSPIFADYGNSVTMAVGAGNVYANADGLVQYAPVGATNATPSTLYGTKSSSKPTTAIAADAQNVYWSDPTSNRILSCPTTGCPGGVPTLMAQELDAATIRGMLVDATDLYWANEATNAIMRCPLATPGSPVMMATNQLQITGLAADATSVYWSLAGSGSTATGAIMAMPK